MNEPSSVWDHPRLHRVFGLDLRSLAALRMGLALLLLVDLANRWGDLRAHYSDAGVLTRETARTTMPVWRWSMHALSGSSWLSAVLMVVAAVFALMLLVGLRTRLATAASWILLLSLHHRNYLLINAGDQLFSLLLLWCVFLPLGARASLDRRRHRPRVEDPEAPSLHLSLGTVAFLLQLFFVYYFTALLKTHPIWTRDGTAIHYALYLDQFTTPFGRWLRGFPDLMRGLSWFSWYLELIGPWLAFVPVGFAWSRTTVVALFVCFHVGLAATMEIGIFPWLCVVAWIALIPGPAWDGVGRVARPLVRRSSAALDAVAALLPRRLLARRATRLPPWQQVLVGVLLGYVACWNVAGLLTGADSRLPISRVPGYVLGLEQRWSMFAPYPLRQDGWYVLPAKLADGSEVDLWRGGQPVIWTKPELVSADYRTQRWRKLMMNLWRTSRGHVGGVATWFRRDWDERHPERVVRTMRVCFQLEITDAEGDGPPRLVDLYELYEDGSARIYMHEENMREDP